MRGDENGAWAGLPRVIGQAAQSLEGGVTSHKLLVFTMEVLALAAVRGIFLFLTRWVVIGISRDIEFDLRNDLFADLETLSYSYYQRMRTGDIMARVTNDLNAVRMLMGPAIMYSANTLVFTAAALWFMVHNSPRLTLYAFLPLPVVSVTIQYFGRRIHDRFEEFRRCSRIFLRELRKTFPERGWFAPTFRKMRRLHPSKPRTRNT